MKNAITTIAGAGILLAAAQAHAVPGAATAAVTVDDPRFVFPEKVGRLERVEQTRNAEGDRYTAAYRADLESGLILVTIDAYPAPDPGIFLMQASGDVERARVNSCYNQFELLNGYLPERRGLIERSGSGRQARNAADASLKASFGYTVSASNGAVIPVTAEQRISCYIDGEWQLRATASESGGVPFEKDFDELMTAIAKASL